MFGLDVDALPRAALWTLRHTNASILVVETPLAASKARRGREHEQSRLISWPGSVHTAVVSKWSLSNRDGRQRDVKGDLGGAGTKRIAPHFQPTWIRMEPPCFRSKPFERGKVTTQGLAVAGDQGADRGPGVLGRRADARDGDRGSRAAEVAAGAGLARALGSVVPGRTGALRLVLASTDASTGGKAHAGRHAAVLLHRPPGQVRAGQGNGAGDSRGPAARPTGRRRAGFGHDLPGDADYDGRGGALGRGDHC